MMDLSGDQKKEACDNLDSYDPRLGAGGLAQLMECGGIFPAALTNAKKFCGLRNALEPEDDGQQTCSANVCNIAKAQVCQCVCANMVTWGNLGFGKQVG